VLLDAAELGEGSDLGVVEQGEQRIERDAGGGADGEEVADGGAVATLEEHEAAVGERCCALEVELAAGEGGGLAEEPVEAWERDELGREIGVWALSDGAAEPEERFAGGRGAGAERDEVVLVVEGEAEGRLEVELALLVATGRLKDPDTVVCGQQQGEGDGGVGVDEGDDAGVVLDDGEEVAPPGEPAASADMGGEIL
jgi:hypothetical protein